MTITENIFGQLPDGRTAHLYKLENKSGASAYITDFGGAVVKLFMPDAVGKMDDVVCGYDDLESYLKGDGYQGALIGRFGNRIADGKFSLDGKEYNLICNDGNNHLHGGQCGFSHKLWDAEIADNALVLRLISEDGEEGYPGRLDVTVTYRLTEEENSTVNSLEIDYSATTDKKTLINLTNHSYFNLGGYDSGSVMEHELSVDADSYLPTSQELIPTGEIRFVKNTPFLFDGRRFIDNFDLDNEDIKISGGFDHCFVFNGGGVDYCNTPPVRCDLFCRKSGRRMLVLTDRPCVQIYSANFTSNPDYPFKGGVQQAKHCAVCLETQSAPDLIHHPEFVFSDGILNAGETFRSKTIYRFTVE